MSVKRPKITPVFLVAFGNLGSKSGVFVVFSGEVAFFSSFWSFLGGSGGFGAFLRGFGTFLTFWRGLVGKLCFSVQKRCLLRSFETP